MILFKEIIIIICILCLSTLIYADNEVCLDCHSDEELTTEKRGREISLFLDESIFSKSVHADIECIDCHSEADVEDFPHEEVLKPVFCGDCHDDKQLNFDAASCSDLLFSLLLVPYLLPQLYGYHL